MSESTSLQIHRLKDGETLAEYAERLQAEGVIARLDGESAESYENRVDGLRKGGAFIAADNETAEEYEVRVFGRQLTAEEIAEGLTAMETGLLAGAIGDEAAEAALSGMRQAIQERRVRVVSDNR